MINDFLKKNVKSKNDTSSVAAASGSSKQAAWYKNPLVRKLGYFLIALLIATTLWGYVLMSENPERTIRIEGIPVSFEAGSESDLYSRNLIICGDIKDILPEVSVTVKTTLNDLPRFSGDRVNDIIKATVSLNTVHSTGEHSLYINATTSIGEIEKLSMEKVLITVDDLVERSVPVTASVEGELPDGYWRGEPQLLMNSVTIKGAESEVINIVKAGCIIDLNDRTEPVNDSIELILYDKHDNIIPSASIIGTVPSVTVRMNVLPRMEISMEPNITGQSSMKDIYEITSVNISPSTINVAADAQTLAMLADLIMLEPIDMSGIEEEGTITQEVRVIGLPDDVILINEIESFTVTIDVRERIEEKTFESVPVRFINEDITSFDYHYNTTTCNVTFRGKASLIRNLFSWQLMLTLNMSGYSSGIYSMIPELQFVDHPEYLQELEYEVANITCTITAIN